MKNALKQAFFVATRGLGIQAALRHRRGLAVLCYHGVVDGDHRGRHLYRNTVGATEFDRHMAYLRAHFAPVSAGDVVRWLGGGAPLPDRAVLVTFDDGYRNNLTHAVPILSRHGIPALVSVSTGYIGTDRVLWPTEVELRIGHWPRARLPLPDGSELDLPAGDARIASSNRVRALCKRLPDRERQGYLEHLRREPLAAAATADLDLLRFLSWDEVRELHRRGIAIGSHTVEHPIMTGLDAEALQRELVDSKARIERELGAECPCFVYPNGGPEDLSAATAAAVEAAGYRVAFSLTDGFNADRRSPAVLDRISIPGHVPAAAFHARVNGLLAALGRRRRGRGLACRLATDFRELEAVRADWARLLAAHPRRQVFYGLDWHRAIWDAYGRERSLCTPLVYEGERLVAILPLALEGRQLRCLGLPHSDYNDMLCTGVDPAAALEAMLDALARAGHATFLLWDPLESTCRHASLSIL